MLVRTKAKMSAEVINAVMGFNPLHLFQAVVKDVYSICDVNQQEVSRDIETITKRTVTEGYPFMTKVLPAFGKAILSAYREGRFTPVPWFKKGRGGRLPLFLRGLTKRIFDDAGFLREDASADCVWGIQQICFLLYKYELPYDSRLVDEKLLSLKQVNDSLPLTFSGAELDYEDKSVLMVARNIVNDLLGSLDLKDIEPRHGPGSTSLGPLSPLQKFQYIFEAPFVQGYAPLPYARTFCATGSNTWENIPSDASMQTQAERTSRVCVVPKDSRGPRVISCENPYSMWIQQGQRRVIEQAATRNSFGHINFKDQQINADLALFSSETGAMATLDMKDASDRVSVALVTEIFPDNILPGLLASRSTHSRYKTSDGTEVVFKLRKFAPMGSACCFCVESITFWALAVATALVMQLEGHDPYSTIYVYGDDLIVPTEWAGSIMDRLERFHLRFNRDKSYFTGPFRESCGCDAFRGVVVTPIKLKTLFPRSLSDVSGVAAWVSYMNDFAQQWLWETSRLIESWLEPILGKLPLCRRRDLGFLSAFTFSQEFPEMKVAKDPENPKHLDWCLNNSIQRLQPTSDGKFPRRRLRPFYQGFVIKAWVVTSRERVRRREKEEIPESLQHLMLLDWLSQRKDEPYESFPSTTRPKLKYGWVSVT